ncbi:hypothetical protein DNTS_000575 [Danionella cerebrum]|uniref:BED-type domain-containing protein n=1 Tax=Danionella cerebrum TaxID=2873325 RepID=A0A553Q028_9TELE|nr:hypothetical protein DNTS_000575 [Danionella translucida]
MSLRLLRKKHIDMATGGAAEDEAVLNPLVEKKESHVWKYFACAADDKGNITDHQKPICKRCRRSFISKGGNTSNLIKHLKDRHLERIQAAAG